MSYVVVLPSIYQPYTDDCLATCKLSNILVVDNTVENRGVAASWNLGIDYMVTENAEWLIILSAGVRFGDLGGQEFIIALDAYPTAKVIEGSWGLGWHLIAFRREIFDKVGRFDEAFHPAYFEDNDFAYRIKLAYNLHPPYWPKVDVDAWVRSFAHGERYGGVQADGGALLRYYTDKWGGPPGKETFTTPFDR